jgi:HAD superfamily hydrolase (TIGR01457 family)
MGPPAVGGTRLADRHDAVLLDLDGVLHRGSEPISGAPETVAKLHRLGVPLAFVTNNSARTPGRIAERLWAMGIEARPHEVVTSAQATAVLLRGRAVRTAFVIGEEGIRAALADAGIEVVDGEPARADAVVVGWDRSVDYAKLRTAALLVQRGSALVATNADRSYPAPDGLWPGAGALLAAVTTATGAEAEIVGKPEAPLYREALRRTGGVRALAVGDRLETDILGAAALGIDTLLVLSGAATAADLVRWAAGPGPLPTHVGSDLSVVMCEPAPPAIRPASTPDATAVAGLLAEGGLTSGGTELRIPLTLVAEDAPTSLVGTVALERFGDLVHLRSLAVGPDRRRGAVGLALVARGVRLAAEGGARQVFAVSETAGPFFARLGFERVGTPEVLPEPIRASDFVRESCPDTAEVFRLDLSPDGR